MDQAEAQRAVSTKVEAQKAVHQVGKGAGVQLWTNSLASLLIGRAVVGSQSDLAKHHHLSLPGPATKYDRNKTSCLSLNDPNLHTPGDLLEGGQPLRQK